MYACQEEYLRLFRAALHQQKGALRPEIYLTNALFLRVARSVAVHQGATCVLIYREVSMS